MDRLGTLIPVVFFSLLVEIVISVHVQMTNVGRAKIIEALSENIWPPAMDKVAWDVTRPCVHCHLYKISSQPLTPPVLRIVANHPFVLVAMDLLQFSKSKRTNVAVLVIVDQCSKI